MTPLPDVGKTGRARSGLPDLAITMNSPDAVESIRAARGTAGETMRVGAGTILNERDLAFAPEAGAGCIVTPVLNAPIIRRCVELKISVFPDALGPTEVQRAWDLGATAAMIFPIDAFGPLHIAELKAPMPRIKLLPTGGIALGSLPAFIEAGADGLGIGSPLFDRKQIDLASWERLEHRCHVFLSALD